MAIPLPRTEPWGTRRSPSRACLDAPDVVDEIEGVDQVLGHWNRSQWLRRRLSVAIRSSAVSEVDVAGADGEGLAHSASGEVLPPAGVDEARLGGRGHGAGQRSVCAEMLRFSWGNAHRVESPGLVKAVLADDRARGGPEGCRQTFHNGDSGTLRPQFAMLREQRERRRYLPLAAGHGIGEPKHSHPGIRHVE